MFDRYHALLLAQRFAALETTDYWTRKRIERVVQAQLAAQAYGTDHDCIDAANGLLQQLVHSTAERAGQRASGDSNLGPASRG
jgi:hypothetical protein